MSIIKRERYLDGIKRLSNHLIKKRKGLMKKEDPHQLLLHFLSLANNHINSELREERKSTDKNSSTKSGLKNPFTGDFINNFKCQIWNDNSEGILDRRDTYSLPTQCIFSVKKTLKNLFETSEVNSYSCQKCKFINNLIDCGEAMESFKYPSK